MSVFSLAKEIETLIWKFHIPQNTSNFPKSTIETALSIQKRLRINEDELQKEVLPIQFVADKVESQFRIYDSINDADWMLDIYKTFFYLVSLYKIFDMYALKSSSEEYAYALDLVRTELNLFLEDQMIKLSFASFNAQLKDTLYKTLKQTSTSLNEILSSILPQEENIFDVPIEEATLIDCSLVLSNMLLNANVKSSQFSDSTDWMAFLDKFFDDVIMFFKESPKVLGNIDDGCNILENTKPDYSTLLNSLKLNYPNVYHLISLYIFLQSIIDHDPKSNQSPNYQILIDTMRKFRAVLNQDVQMFDHQIKNRFLKEFQYITQIVENYISNDIGFDYNETFDFLNANIADLGYIELAMGISNICEEVFNFLNPKDALFSLVENFLKLNTIKLEEFYITPYQTKALLSQTFQRDFVAAKQENARANEFLNQHPILLKLCALDYYCRTLASYLHHQISYKHKLLLFESITDLHNQPYTEALFETELSDKVVDTMIQLDQFGVSLMLSDSVTEFICLAKISNINIIGTIEQGESDFLKVDDGLCAGYAVELAQYVLKDVMKVTGEASRIERWQSNQMGSESPFSTSKQSAYVKLRPSEKTYDLQKFYNINPLEIVNITDTIQVEYALSPHKFLSGAEIAYKVLELCQENPNTVVLLLVINSNSPIGHALACYVFDNHFYFFCATHSWVKIHLNDVNPNLYFFMHEIFEKNSFFNTYDAFYCEYIFPTYQAPAVNSENLHYEVEFKDFPYIYPDEVSNQLMSIVQECQESYYDLMYIIKKFHDQV